MNLSEGKMQEDTPMNESVATHLGGASKERSVENDGKSGSPGSLEINIIEEQRIRSEELSIDEIENIFQQLSDNYSSKLTDGKNSFNAFAQSYMEQLSLNAKLAKPPMPELLLRRIVQISSMIQAVWLRTATDSDYNPNVIVKPIIVSRTGAFALPEVSKMVPKPKTDSGVSVQVRFDDIVECIMRGVRSDKIVRELYMAPPNEELKVVGIMLYPPTEQHPRNHLRAPIANQIRSYSWESREINLASMMLSGSIIGKYLSPLIFNTNIVGSPAVEGHEYLFHDLNISKVTDLLSYVFDYIVDVYNTITSSDATARAHYRMFQAIKEISSISETPKLLSASDLKLTPTLPPKMLPFLDELGAVAGRKISTATPGTMLFDIHNADLLNIYYSALRSGKDSEDVRREITNAKMRLNKIEFQRKIQEAITAEIAQTGIYMNIIDRKLGGQRAADIGYQLRLRPQLSTKSSNILSLLKPNERKIVELEYERREKYLDEIARNKCSHLAALRSFRNASSDEDRKHAIKEVENYIAGRAADQRENVNYTGKNLSIIPCSKCKFDLICPHILELTHLELSRAQYQEIKSRMQKYIDDIPTNENFYCRLCGEVISSIETFGSVSQESDQSSEMTEDLRTTMWSEILSATRSLKFSNIINLPKLIAATREACYPYISEIEKQILKSKTISAEEIKNKKRLYITIYAYAYFIHLVVSQKSKTDIEFKGFTGSPSSKTFIVDLIKHVFSTIVMAKNIIIKSLTDISLELIKNKLIDAYRTLSSGGSTVIQYSNETEELLITLLLDPIFHWVVDLNLMFDNNIKNIRASRVNLVDNVMGATVNKIEKFENIYDEIHLPKFPKENIDAFNGIASSRLHKSNSVDVSEISKKDFKKMYSGYIARSFQVFRTKLLQRLYNNYIYAGVSKVSGDTMLTTDSVKWQENYNKHFAELAEVKNREQLLMNYKRMQNMVNQYGLKADKNSQFVKRDVKLGRVYDENGNIHKWDTYLIKSGIAAAGRNKSDNAVDDHAGTEILASDVVKMIENGEKPTFIIVDKKCSACGIEFSKSDILDEAKIIESLHIKNNIINFYRFYENRCPKGNLHELVGDKCKKCGYDIKYQTNSTSNDSLNYYRGFKNIYNEEKNEFSARNRDDVLVVSDQAKIENHIENIAEKYKNWSFNFNVIIDLSTKLKITNNLIMCLGGIEKQEYNDVLNGTFIPAEPSDKYSTRSFVLVANIKMLVMEYNILRYFHRVAKPPMELVKIIDASGISRHRLHEISEHLPSVFTSRGGSDKFYNEIEYFRKNKKPREIVSFCLQSFCELCLDIYDGVFEPEDSVAKTSDTFDTIMKETQKLRHDFVEYFVKKMLKRDEMVTKPGYFNWSLLYGDKETKAAEEAPDADNIDDESDPQTSAAAMAAINEDDEDTAGAFKGFNDLDMEAPDDPDDPDADGNDVKVGEEYGLD